MAKQKLSLPKDTENLGGNLPPWLENLLSTGEIAIAFLFMSFCGYMILWLREEEKDFQKEQARSFHLNIFTNAALGFIIFAPVALIVGIFNFRTFLWSFQDFAQICITSSLISPIFLLIFFIKKMLK